MIITTAAAYCLALNVYFEARGEEHIDFIYQQKQDDKE